MKGGSYHHDMKRRRFRRWVLILGVLIVSGAAGASMAYAIEPSSPPDAPLAHSPGPSRSVARGDYLANRVAGCVSCHTDRDDRGQLTGPRFGGGQRMDIATDATKVFVPPNLTPDADTSPVGRWDEDQFVARFGRAS
jgi:hypothetical protein